MPLAGAIYISIEAGVLLGAAYLVTRRLWLRMGFQMAWNYTQSAIFSASCLAASTTRSSAGQHYKADSADGGSFGMERSVFALVLCSSAGVVLLMVAIRRGHIVPAPWKRANVHVSGESERRP